MDSSDVTSLIQFKSSISKIISILTIFERKTTFGSPKKKGIYRLYTAFCSPRITKETIIAARPPTNANPPKM